MANFSTLLPNMGGFNPKSQPEQINELRTVVYSLIRNLDGALSSIDESNFSPAYPKANLDVKEVVMALLEKTKPGQPLAEETIKNLFRKLRDTIIENAYEINQTFNVALSEKANSILAQVSEDFAAKSEIGDLYAHITSEMEQTSHDILMKFAESYDYALDIDGQLQAFKEELQRYIRFSLEGIEIGEKDSPFTAKFDNLELGFYQNGQKIAYFANNKLFVVAVQTEKLTIGNSGSGFIDMYVSAKGLIAKYRTQE